jgi:hypothetical protein
LRCNGFKGQYGSGAFRKKGNCPGAGSKEEKQKNFGQDVYLWKDLERICPDVCTNKSGPVDFSRIKTVVPGYLLITKLKTLKKWVKHPETGH